MSQDFPKFELEHVLNSDVADIFAAREKARILHHARDIRSSGDEVEQTIRKVLRRKLPISYYIGHGHIVDQHMNTSPQLDVVITDNASTSVLFQAENGSEYFPYEAVYAIGEAKSSYEKDKCYIHKFSKHLANIRASLTRENTAWGVYEKTNEQVRYGNPLFSFMLFVHSGNFHIEDILDLYQTTTETELPTVIYFLDKGMILKAYFPMTGSSPNDHKPLQTISLATEYLTHEMQTIERVEPHWVFTSYDAFEGQFASNFGFFYYKLAMHLQKCTLSTPNLLIYLNQMLGSPTSTIISRCHSDST